MIPLSRLTSRKLNLLRFTLALLLVIIMVPAFAARVRVIDTGTATTLEGLSYSGGSFFKKVSLIHPAFLVEHGEDRFLIDTGLGQKAHQQFSDEMPWWAKPVMGFEQTASAREVLDREKIEVKRLFISHVHFDHMSGVPDFPDSEIWVAPEDLDFIKHPSGMTVFKSTYSDSTKWKAFEWSANPYKGYERSYDVYGDGSVVLVPMPGHTPGSFGAFITLDNGRQAFLVGDTVWNRDAIAGARQKFCIARAMVDDDSAAVERQIERLKELSEREPDLIIVPSHDRTATNELQSIQEKK